MAALAVGAGGVAGALLRFAVDTWFSSRRLRSTHRARASYRSRSFPWATLVVNAAGSLLIGCAFGALHSIRLQPDLYAVLATGLAGGLTTFSSWTVASVGLLEERRYRAAAGNLLLNICVGLGLAWLGYLLLR